MARGQHGGHEKPESDTVMLSAFRRPTYLAAVPALRLDELQTGDLVLFSGRTFAARLVQAFTGSYWSHVGIVVRLPEYSEPLLWEATRASKVADIHRGEIFDGVQLVPLAQKLASYPGEVVVRRLVGAETARRRYRRIKPLVRQWGALPYCNFVIKQLRACWRGHEALAGQRGGFCSEFVAEVYKHLQLLPPDKPSINYVPRDFAPDAPLSLLRGRLAPARLLMP
jgi:hypothetical protein